MRRIERTMGMAALSAAVGLAGGVAEGQEHLQSSLYPLRVHYPAGENAKAETILAAAEDAWAFQIEEQGFPPPPADGGLQGSDDFDVVIQTTPVIAYTEATAPAADRPLGWASRLVLDPSLPDSAIPLVVSHELHHAVQVGICLIGNNLAEAGAVLVSGIHRAGEAWHLTYSLGFNTYQQSPWKSVDWQAGVGDYYPYGGALFLLFVDETRGDGTPLGAYRTLLSDVYAHAAERGACPSYLDVFRQRFDVDQAYAEFARWRYFVGPEDDGAHFSDLENWEGPNQTLESVALEADVPLSALPLLDVPLMQAPMEYGAAYVRLDVAELAPEERIALALGGDPAVRWRLGVIRRFQAGSEEEEIEIPETGLREVELDPRGAAQLVLAFVNLGDGAHTDDGSDWSQSPLSFSLSRVELEVEQEDPEQPAAPSAPAASEGGCACAARGAEVDWGWALGLVLLAAARRRQIQIATGRSPSCCQASIGGSDRASPRA